MAGPAQHRGAGRLLAATLTTAAVALSFALAAACGTTTSGDPGAGSPRLTRSTGIVGPFEPSTGTSVHPCGKAPVRNEEQERSARPVRPDLAPLAGLRWALPGRAAKGPFCG
jgi:hypothetical protein